MMARVDYDFSALEKGSESLMQRFGFLEVAMRQSDLAFEVRDYLSAHPNADFFIFSKSGRTYSIVPNLKFLSISI